MSIKRVNIRRLWLYFPKIIFQVTKDEKVIKVFIPIDY